MTTSNVEGMKKIRLGGKHGTLAGRYALVDEVIIGIGVGIYIATR
jgi:hypothetical protein